MLAEICTVSSTGQALSQVKPLSEDAIKDISRGVNADEILRLAKGEEATYTRKSQTTLTCEPTPTTALRDDMALLCH